MNIRLSEKTGRIEASKTVAFTPLIQQLRSQGKSVIDLAVGEPEYDTPAPVVEGVKKALDARRTRYGPVSGLPDLRERLAGFYPGWDERNIVVSNGSKQALFLIFQVILDPADEVIIPRPCWVSFFEQVRMAGGRPVFVDAPDHRLNADAVLNAVTEKTKALIINSPNNPTGAVYTDREVAAVLSIAAEAGLFVVSDEAYDGFFYDNCRPARVFDMAPDHSRLIIIRSFSKHYNMTGFRIGYAAADKEIIRAMTAWQGHCSGNVCTFAQYGALAALAMGDDSFEIRRQELEEKRNSAYDGISQRFDCIRPSGAFYIFPSIEKYLSGSGTAMDFSADLLEKTGVAVVPGEAFGCQGHIRISYAVPTDLLAEGIKRINDYVERKF